MCRNVILVGECTDVFYAKEKDGHEEGGHGSGSTLERHGMLPELLSICDHGCTC
jgi:hypothetical protein